MLTTSSFNFVSIFTVVCLQIGIITCQINATVGTWELRATLDDKLFVGGSIAASADLTVIAIGDASYDNGPSNINTFLNNFGRARVVRYSDNSAMPQWEQLGKDIIGDNEGDNFGSALATSADGLTIAVGADGNDGESHNFISIGHVKVLKYNTVTKKWKQVGADIVGEMAYDESGRSVSISADGMIVAIAGPNNSESSDIPIDFIGHVRVYQLNLTTQQWEQLGADIDHGEDIETDFSYQYYENSVVISADGKTIAIGSRDGSTYYQPLGYDFDFGYVQVYKYSTSAKQWKQLGAVLTGPTTSIEFGSKFSLSADGTTIAASSVIPLDEGDIFGPYEFHVQVFKFSKVGASWRQVGDLFEVVDGYDIVCNRNVLSPTSLDMSDDGKTIAVSTTKNNHVRVYTNTYGATWERVGSDIIGSVVYIAISADGRSVAVKGEQLRVYNFVPTPKPTCDISWNLYNAKTNTLLAPLVNGTIITSPPPCNQTNIEAVVPCAPTNGTISMELYSVSATTSKLSLVHRRRERLVQFFLFGNSRNDIFGGRVPSGTYLIRAVDSAGTPSPFTKFTIGGSCG